MRTTIIAIALLTTAIFAAAPVSAQEQHPPVGSENWPVMYTATCGDLTYEWRTSVTPDEEILAMFVTVKEKLVTYNLTRKSDEGERLDTYGFYDGSWVHREVTDSEDEAAFNAVERLTDAAIFQADPEALQSFGECKEEIAAQIRNDVLGNLVEGMKNLGDQMRDLGDALQ